MASNTRHITIHAPAAFRRLPNGVFWDHSVKIISNARERGPRERNLVGL